MKPGSTACRKTHHQLFHRPVCVYGVPGFGFGPSEYSNTKRDAYGKFNLRAGISGEYWSIEAWSKNLTDEDYLEIIPHPSSAAFIHDSAGRISGWTSPTF